MVLYCYCTYKLSPVGYAIGRVGIPMKDEEFTYLEPCGNSFVRKCFETAIIRKVDGKHSNGHYCFMVKGLKCRFVDENNVPSHKSGNFFFDFDESEKEKYKCVVQNYNKAALEKAMNEFIVPDSFAETFALKIQTNKLNEYIKTLISDNSETDKKIVCCSFLRFHTKDPEIDHSNELTKIAGQQVYRDKEDDQEIYSTKKKYVILLEQIGAKLVLLPRKIKASIKAFMNRFAKK